MSHILNGFSDELLKLGGVASALYKAVKKSPTLTLGALGTAGATGYAATSAYKKGRTGAMKPRYLHATVDPVTGQGLASRAAHTNYNVLFPGKPGKRAKKRLHGKYKEKAFKGNR